MPNSLTTNVTVPGIWEMKEEEEKFMKENLYMYKNNLYNYRE